MRWSIVFLWMFVWGMAQPTDSLQMVCQLRCQQQPLALHQWTRFDDQSRIRLSVCKFYLSGLAYADAQNTYPLTQPQALLVDFHNPLSLTWRLPSPPHTAQRLYLVQGITDALNDAGVGEGVLDPALGMYWTWETGYIHTKMEGELEINGKTQPFTLHLGGFLAPFHSAQRMEWPLPSSKAVWNLRLDLYPLFKALCAQSKRDLMSPSAAAVQLSHILATCWHVD